MAQKIDRIAPMTGADLAAALDDLAQLRIAVFREWPYLYDGDPDYEARYLAAYRDSPGAVVVGAWDGGRLVGAATAAPMEDHAPEFADPLRAQGLDPKDIFYCGESVLLPAYRGQGAGHAFFDLREAQGRALGRWFSAFCAVRRPEDHPLRPADYRPLDPFWTARGYRRLDGVEAGFSWKDIDMAEETEKPMAFWLRALD